MIPGAPCVAVAGSPPVGTRIGESSSRHQSMQTGELLVLYRVGLGVCSQCTSTTQDQRWAATTARPLS